MEKPIRILLVDDEADFRAVISDHLEDKGYQVSSLGSGQEAVLATQEWEFDVALLDIKMPGVNGIDLLRTLKELDPTTEVIMLTGHASIETAVQAIDLDVYGDDAGRLAHGTAALTGRDAFVVLNFASFSVLGDISLD